ncbi:uncharacterized protein [Nicotiana sylvestris]|uniref:uncharacterized protein n=1 Tax=Nicotiana sylvestris TaxID=4096 RepID=UPI00388C89DF
MLDDKHRRLERFGRLQPPTFSGAEGEDAQGFWDKFQQMLRTTGILESSGVAFTTFQFSGAAFTWWEAYVRRRPVGAVPLTWHEFSTLFLEKYVPRSRKEELCRQFEWLRKGDMTVSQYESRLPKLAHHGVWMVPTDRERIRRFVDGLNYHLYILMNRESVLGATFEELVNIAREIETMVRTRSTRGDQTPAPPTRAVRGRGRGRGRGRARSAAIAPTRAATEEPPVVPARAQAPDAPTTTTAPALQETLAQFLIMFGRLV